MAEKDNMHEQVVVDPVKDNTLDPKSQDVQKPKATKRSPRPKIDKEKLKVRVPILKSHKQLRSNYCANFSQIKYFTILDKGLEKIKSIKEKKEIKEFKEAENVVVERKSKKKKVMNIVFLMLNIIFIATFIFVQGKNGLVAPPDELHANWWFLIVAMGLVLCWIILDTFRFHVLIHKAIGFGRLGLAYKISSLGKYYDIVTPFSTGGQPFQIFYANKYGIKAGHSVSIAMSKYMFQQIAYFILVTVVMFSNLRVSAGAATGVVGTLINTLSWIGYIVIAVLMSGICLIMLNKKVGVSIVVFFLKLFCKIFKKDYNVLFRSVMKTVTAWQNSMRKYKKSPFVWMSCLTASVAFYLVQYSIPFFIYCAFEGYHPEVWSQILTMSIMVDLALSIYPVPAGAGLAEISFDSFFKGLFHSSTLWAMLIWRFLTSYFFVLQGLTIIIYDYTIGNKRRLKYNHIWIQRGLQRSKVLKKLPPKEQAEMLGAPHPENIE